jgi:predicted GNAT superfamily acetyltransferase
MVEIRALDDSAALEQVVDLEIAVWDLHPRDAVPSSLMHVLALGGGLVLGAFDDADGSMVGMLLALPVRRDGEWLLWSHMTGVHPAWRGRGVGAALKRWQWAWAREGGYTRIGWTFDPLQRGNAHFNLHLLARESPVTAAAYHVNFYGEMQDGINRGIPSDRLEVMWHLDRPPASSIEGADAPALLAVVDGAPVVQPEGMHTDSPYCRIAIPDSVDALRAAGGDVLLRWRLAQRAAFQAALAAGWIVSGFTARGGFAYLLQRA